MESALWAALVIAGITVVKRWKKKNPDRKIVEFHRPSESELKKNTRDDWASMEVKGGPNMGSFDPNEAMKW